MIAIARTVRTVALFAALAAGPGALAQVSAAPGLINFQGRLTAASGTPVADGAAYVVTVSLWDAATGGTQLWSETLNNVAVKDGAFSALLTPSPAGVFNGANLWLQTQVGSDPPMAPRQQIASVPFALKANAVPDGSIGAPQLDSDAASLARVTDAAMGVSGLSVVLYGKRTMEFGHGLDKELNAGKIGYEVFSPDALDIVGAGTDATNRKVDVYAEGGTQFTGEVTVPAINVLGGSDVAEPYQVASVAGIQPKPGMVVVMHPDRLGELQVASRAYDPTVAGIISGANGIRPGITLRQAGTVADGAFPVASVGRVWCRADADANGPITKGSLLTTSDTPGYAMRATDAARENGAVVGKAMSRLTSGKGLVLVLVSLR